MILIDTHAHLYDKQFDDISEVVKRCSEQHVKRVYLPNVDSNSISGVDRLSDDYPDFFYPMMGLHPCSVKADYKEELTLIKNALDQRKYVGVGEIGIDLYWDKTFVNEQIHAYNTQINWAKDKQLPIIIHSRDSLEYTIKGIKEAQNGDLKGIFHCFNGTLEQAYEIIDLGFYLGIGGVVTFKNAGVDKIVKELPLSSIVLETDAPYLAPVPYRGKRNESAYLSIIAEKIADIKEENIEIIAKATTQNALNLFQ